MITLHPQFIKDTNGEKSFVILPYKEFDKIMDELDEIERIRLYDEAQKTILVNEFQWKMLLM